MKKLLTLLFALLMAQNISAQKAWTVETIPNTRLQSNFIHVSDPDGYISAETEKRINTALSTIRDTADVFVVALKSIGDKDSQMFRNELFKYWGIGDKNKNNGMLLLFVEDKHKFEFETGYGIEPVMTDAKCFEIFNHTIKPYFKKGDYEGGIYAGVIDIVEVFGGTEPTELIQTLPDEEVYKTAISEKDKETISDFYMWILIILGGVLPIFSIVRYFYRWEKDKKAGKIEIKDSYNIEEIDGVSYISDFQNTWTGSAWQGKGCSRALTFGLSGLAWLMACSALITAMMTGKEELYRNNWVGAVSIVVYLTWICWRHNVRTLKMADKVAKSSINPKQIYKKAKNYRRTVFVNAIVPWLGIPYNKKYDRLGNACPEMQCPTCHSAMSQDTELKLSEKQAFENKNDIKKYMSLRCLQGHTFVMVENGANYHYYSTCPKCGVQARKKVDAKVIEKATYTSMGLEELTYVCQFCGDETKLRESIPMLVHTTSSSDDDSSYDSYDSSDDSDSGSFGGGSSGGGGYSGSW